MYLLSDFNKFCLEIILVNSTMITQQIQKRQPYLIAILSIEPKNKTLIP